MSRSKTYGLVVALLASTAMSAACTRTDATGPSEQTPPSFENTGANNSVEITGANNLLENTGANN
jgi:hypothetical protein